MRKAYKKARWKKLAARVEKRGGVIIFGFKPLPDAPRFPLTYDGIKRCIEYLNGDNDENHLTK